MHPTVFFDRIMIAAPRERIYRRLGYRPGVTCLPAGQEAEVEGYIADALSLINLRGAGRRLTVQTQPDAQVFLNGQDGEEVFHSRRLAAFLQECGEAVLMGATAGEEVMAAIAGDVTGDRLTRGVVIDAVASEMVDASLDWIMSYFSRELRRENKALKQHRYSAGYGDFRLENQAALFRLLELSRLGVQITASFLLIPEKSVTAIAGVISGS
ncbi:MAG: hypothetical protein Q8K46_01110 [Deltaproteobacteria bacterium]|nr:hypothetical protein [Deltaproteobacteria bacterium]